MSAASVALFFIALHMIGDYVTQTNWMAANKLRSGGVRTLHVLIYSIPFWVLGCLSLPTGENGILLFVSVFIPHWIIDCRRWASPDPWPPKPIMVDQSLHALHLAIIFFCFYG